MSHHTPSSGSTVETSTYEPLTEQQKQEAKSTIFEWSRQVHNSEYCSTPLTDFQKDQAQKLMTRWTKEMQQSDGETREMPQNNKGKSKGRKSPSYLHPHSSPREQDSSNYDHRHHYERNSPYQDRNNFNRNTNTPRHQSSSVYYQVSISLYPVCS